MRFDAAQLPDTVEALQSLVLDFAELRQNYETEISVLKEEISLLKHRLFGRKSEKLPVGTGQLLLLCARHGAWRASAIQSAVVAGW